MYTPSSTFYMKSAVYRLLIDNLYAHIIFGGKNWIFKSLNFICPETFLLKIKQINKFNFLKQEKIVNLNTYSYLSFALLLDLLPVDVEDFRLRSSKLWIKTCLWATVDVKDFLEPEKLCLIYSYKCTDFILLSNTMKRHVFLKEYNNAFSLW